MKAELVNVKHVVETEIMSPRRYHHGDLRAALLDAAADEIQAVGAARLSLRELARRAGVSHAAPAHHFGDKRGLFTALAAEGFRMLHGRTAEALDSPEPLIEAGRIYIEFALEHPAHFAVMFDDSLVNADEGEYARERATAFDRLFAAVQLATDVRSPEDLAAQSLTAWALVHGLATLWLSGNLPYPPHPQLVTTMLAELADGIGPVANAAVDQLRSLEARRG